MPSDKKTPHILHHVTVDRPVCVLAGSVAEVIVPAAQDRVQPVLDLRPRPAMGRMETIANFLLKPGHTLRRRARPQIQFAIAPMPVRAEAVAQEVEPFPPRILQLSLDLIQGQPEPGDRVACPVQRLGRSPAA